MLIRTDAHVAAGLDALLAIDPALAPVAAGVASPLPLRLRSPGFAGLAGIVVSQQVSVASARAIFARLEAQLPALDAGTILAATEQDLRACGLSGPKIRTLRAIAAAEAGGQLAFAALADLSAEEAHGALCAVSGIGPWTADVYLMFCLGHADAFAAGDLALQEAARLILGLDGRPDARDLTAIAERWRPWRSVAARLLWAHYGAVTRRSTTLP